MISAYLIDVIILLIAAVVAVPYFQTLKLGAVPGFLVAGVIVGPFALGLISNVSEIAHLAEIGVVFLLFLIGIELKPARLWQLRRLVFGLGTLQVFLTGAILTLGLHYLFEIPLRASILIGPALALSSTAIVLQLLSEKKLLTSIFGRTSFSILLLQDLAVVPLLALLPLLVMPDLSIGEDIGIALFESMVILCLIVLIGRYLLHPLLHRVALSGNPEIFTASAVLLVLGTAYVAELAGLSMAMGAFMAGLLISDSSYKHQIVAEIQPFRGLLLGLFFMSMGMSLNLGLFFETPFFYIGMLILLISVKAIVLIPLTYLFKLETRNCLAVALILAQSGEFALVLFSMAFESKLLDDLLFQQLLLVVLMSMLITPFLAKIIIRFVKAKTKVEVSDVDQPPEAPIVIAGFGRVGRKIGAILSLANKSYVALDSDASLIESERGKGHPVFYGDVRKPELLKAAGAAHAQVIIVTLNDPEGTEEVVSALRESHPEKIIYARGHSLQQCQELRKIGASGAVSENLEASLELARLALSKIGVAESKRDKILNDFRIKYRSQIEDVLINDINSSK